MSRIAVSGVLSFFTCCRCRCYMNAIKVKNQNAKSTEKSREKENMFRGCAFK